VTQQVAYDEILTTCNRQWNFRTDFVPARTGGKNRGVLGEVLFILPSTMDNNSQPKDMATTRNSRLLPATFDPVQVKHGIRTIPESHGPKRRPKSGDFKLFAAYVAAYTGPLIPPDD
jgi:hypothetical protein